MKLSDSSKTILKQYYFFIRDFFKELLDDRLEFYSSSLSWNTLFSIIPMMAILLAVFTYMPLFQSVHDKIEALIIANLMPTDSKVIMEYFNTFISNSGKLGLIGFVYIIVAAILFFKNYDYIVNDIFEAPKRNLWQAVKTYLGMIIVVPLMLGGSLYLSSVFQSPRSLQVVADTIHLSYFIPYLISWAMFYLTYQVSANKKISPKAALISSFIASLVWHITRSGFVLYVLYNSTYASIYGGISILLFFFLWIYLSWAIFLHGLRFCYLLDKGIQIDRI